MTKDKTKDKTKVEETVRRNKVYWDGEFLIVEARSGNTYKFEEQLGSVIEDAAKSSTIKRTEKGEIVTELRENLMFDKLIVKSCIDPILKESEFDINKVKGSETVTLKKAIMQLYDIEAFLK